MKPGKTVVVLFDLLEEVAQHLVQDDPTKPDAALARDVLEMSRMMRIYLDGKDERIAQLEKLLAVSKGRDQVLWEKIKETAEREGFSVACPNCPCEYCGG